MRIAEGEVEDVEEEVEELLEDEAGLDEAGAEALVGAGEPLRAEAPL